MQVNQLQAILDENGGLAPALTEQEKQDRRDRMRRFDRMYHTDTRSRTGPRGVLCAAKKRGAGSLRGSLCGPPGVSSGGGARLVALERPRLTPIYGQMVGLGLIRVPDPREQCARPPRATISYSSTSSFGVETTADEEVEEHEPVEGNLLGRPKEARDLHSTLRV